MTDASMLCAQTPRNPVINDPDFQLYVGDALEVLRELPGESVHAVVTSPPYWGLRCYGVDGQYGLEDTPEAFVAQMVSVFREVRRVLRADGTCWLNLGDSYAAQGGGKEAGVYEGKRVSAADWQPPRSAPSGLKPKDLVGIPWRVAFALQADGWFLRSDIIWAKPNPMPESVTDRPTKAHEYLFLLTKSPRYFFDQEAVREKYQSENTAEFRTGSAYVNQNGPQNNSAKGPDGRRNTRVLGADGSIQHRDGERWPNGGRNIRSVWEIATQPYAEAHFATFPQELPARCIKAGTSERGCCPECGAPWEREVERGPQPPEPEHRHPGKRLEPGQAGNVGAGNMGFRASRLSGQEMARWRAAHPDTTKGWLPSCDHDQQPVPCTVLDPFMGSGTTALVARKLGRRSIGIELNEEYARLAARRLQQQSLFAGDAA